MAYQIVLKKRFTNKVVTTLTCKIKMLAANNEHPLNPPSSL
jgi:hypothetical protein